MDKYCNNNLQILWKIPKIPYKRNKYLQKDQKNNKKR